MDNERPWWAEETTAEDSGSGGGFEGISSEHVGNAAQEAARLFDAVRDRLLSDPATVKAGMTLVETFSSFAGTHGSPVGPGEAPECAYCPVCQALTRAQRLNPESVVRLTSAAMEFAEVVRDSLSAPAPKQDDGLRHVPLDDEEPAEPADQT